MREGGECLERMVVERGKDGRKIGMERRGERMMMMGLWVEGCEQLLDPLDEVASGVQM